MYAALLLMGISWGESPDAGAHSCVFAALSGHL
jgi:hypothetical protein